MERKVTQVVASSVKGLLERLANGGTVVCAEGYVNELERRGYLQSGKFIPEVVLNKPEVVRVLHEEFVHAGSDVVEAFTYWGSRHKLQAIGREDDLEKLNRIALKMARHVANETGCLMAGNISNTSVFDYKAYKSEDEISAMFKEQVTWAVEEGADYMIGETYTSFREAMLALQAILQHGKGLPAVITLNPCVPDVTLDGVPFPEACRELEKAGASVVGLNCGRGPNVMMPLIREIRKVCKGPIAALPVCYRTNEKFKTWYNLPDPDGGSCVLFRDIQCQMSKRSEIRAFAEEAKAAGVQYIGLCCGNASHYIREVAEVYGREPPASQYSPVASFTSYDSDEPEIKEAKRKLRKHFIGEHAQVD